MWTKIVNFYNQNAYFHSFVVAVEMAVASFATSYSGGLPASKAGWTSLGFGVGGAIWGAAKRWLALNVATTGLQLKNGK